MRLFNKVLQRGGGVGINSPAQKGRTNWLFGIEVARRLILLTHMGSFRGSVVAAQHRDVAL